MSYKSVFKMPNPVKITGRTSSITNSFVNGIIPVIEPSESEIKEALSVLGMTAETICCAYCGDKYTEWDHLRPLVINKSATGYISEIHNLVPSCGKCNQSKGNQNWKEWMYGSAKLSPASRHIKDIDARAKRLAEYEQWGTPIRLDFEKIVGSYKWQKHWNNCDNIKGLMYESQKLSDEIKQILVQALKEETRKLQISDIEKAKKVIDKKHLSVAKNESPYDVEIKSVNFKGKPVGKIVQGEFLELLQSGMIPAELINKLESKEYSKSMFDMNFPILMKISSENDKRKGVDHTGVNRYYAKPVYILGDLYLLTSQWYDRNKDKLIAWIYKYGK